MRFAWPITGRSGQLQAIGGVAKRLTFTDGSHLRGAGA